ncbi:NAD(P)-dependent alcohol dehydrogenase [Arthrobacter sp. P2b]|uniref:NAD(P)-dependent alcohol dehydrogenase n=1 Tax=Arthrobacter sp. P2b TaxID=1938741 RepID=UPI0009A65C5E|nr:NAD(P)-dependent alcohol dehydrogenase [Arthrobacter sp. P2b]SLK10499.1 aryl-alcohol dehydrogenase [Arthrobacter sp. P2b]
MQSAAAVVRAVGEDFSFEAIEVSDPASREVLVEIAGVGLCHTDLAVRDGHIPFPFPSVLGHEGSGRVLRVGDKVTRVAVGDSVAISFNSCGECRTCRLGKPSYCLDFAPLNFGGTRPDGTGVLSRGTETLGGNFFGQSSFALHAVANERNVVKVADDIPLELIGPLGCGFQTGAGAVLNSLDCAPGSSLVITGAGSVGMAAIMAGVVRGLEHIIVVEPQEGRRDLARALGATNVIDPAAGPVSASVREIVPEGADYIIDTTGLLPVLEESVLSLARLGKLGILGVPSDPAAALALNLGYIQLIGGSVVGIVEGDSDPDVFIPYLLDLHREGKFPFDKLITTFPLSKINEAVSAQHSGEAVKVVLLTDEGKI